MSIDKVESCIIQSGYTGAEKENLLRSKKRLYSEVYAELGKMGVRMDEVSDSRVNDLVEQKINEIMENHVGLMAMSAKKQKTIGTQIDEVAKKAAIDDPDLYWDYVAAMIGYRTSGQGHGIPSAESKLETWQASWENGLKPTFDALFSPIAGSTVVKSKGNDLKFLEMFMSGKEPTGDDEISKGIRAYLQVEDTKYQTDQRIKGVSSAKPIPSKTRELPALIVPDKMMQLGKNAWVDLFLAAKPKGIQRADAEHYYDEVTNAAMSEEGFYVSADTKYEFTDPKGYLNYIRQNGADSLSVVMSVNNVQKARSLAVYDALGDPNAFIRQVKDTARKYGIPEGYSVTKFRQSTGHIETMVDAVTGDIDKTVGKVPKINDEASDFNNGVIVVKSTMPYWVPGVKDRTFQATPKEQAQLQRAETPEDQKKLASALAKRRLAYEVPNQFWNKYMPIGRSFLNVGRLGKAAFGFFGEAGMGAMGAAMVSDYSALNAFLSTWRDLSRVTSRADMQDFAMQMGVMSADMRSYLQQMARGASEGDTLPNQFVHQSSSLILEASGFKFLAANSSASRANMFSRALTMNLKRYGTWEKIPQYYRDSLQSYGFNQQVWDAMHQAWRTDNDVRLLNNFAGVQVQQFNPRGIKDPALREQVTGAFIQFQRVTSGEKIADSSAGISRSYLGARAAPRGAAEREISESMFTFLNYPIVTFSHIVAPYFKMAMNQKDKRAQLAGIMLTMMFAGYVNYQARNLMRDGEFQETTPENALEHIGLALGYSGIGGLWASVLFDPYSNEIGPSGIANAPIFDWVGSGMSVIGDIADHTISQGSEEYDKSFRQAVMPGAHRFMTKTIPNVWWMEWGTGRFWFEKFREANSVKNTDTLKVE